MEFLLIRRDRGVAILVSGGCDAQTGMPDQANLHFDALNQFVSEESICFRLGCLIAGRPSRTQCLNPLSQCGGQRS